MTDSPTYEVRFNGVVIDTFSGLHALYRANRFADHHYAQGKGYTIEVCEVTSAAPQHH